MSHRHARRLAGVAVFAVGLGATSPARAGDVDPISTSDAQEVIDGVDGEITRAKTDYAVVQQAMGGQTVTGEAKLERRIREGELYTILGDHLRASVLLFDVVDDRASRSHPRFDHAQYLLGDALRKLQNFQDARRYLEDLLPRVRGERLKQVVFALIDIANQTKRFEHVEQDLDALRAGGGVTAPEIDYIHGKSVYVQAQTIPDEAGQRAQLQRAHDLFARVPAGTPVSTAAAYYRGVCLTGLRRYDDAIRAFDDTVARSGKLAEQRALRDLAKISLGRLYFEQDKVEEAVRAYESIGQSSAQFQDMLFEVAWAHVRAAKAAKDDEQRQVRLTKALRMAELLMTSSPEARLYPEARILEGNLQIRLGAPETAYDTFESLIDRYGGARSQLAELLSKNPDPRQFFDQLVGGDAKDVTNVGFLPPVAVDWAVGRPEMRQAVDVLADLKDSEKNALESKELIDALSRALDGEQRFGVGGLDRARKLAQGVENRVVLANARLTSLERRMVLPYVGDGERRRLDEIAGRRGALETELRDLPTSEEDMSRTVARTREAFRAADHRVYKQSIAINGMRAQLAAVDVWLVQYRDFLSREQLESIRLQLDGAKAEVASLEKDVTVLAHDARLASTLAAGDGGVARAEQLRKDYDALMREEVEILRSLRGSLPPELSALTSKVDGQRVSLDGIRSDVFSAKGRMETTVKARVDEVRAIVRAEDAKLRDYERETALLRAETDAMLGPVASAALRAVSQEFNELVLKADVGIIDVAWARKQQVTDRVAKVVREQQDRTREMETEFQDVIQGN
jgi:tetratricopeptide (TPR) repeat protein